MICLEGECCFFFLYGYWMDFIFSVVLGNIEIEMGKV